MNKPPSDFRSGCARTRPSRGASSVSASLKQLSRIGGSDRGVTRLAWSKELFEAYEWVAARMRELGLTVEIDAAGNLIGRWEVGSGKPLVVGWHLDTVPRGGAFDGALGVVAAVHAVRRLQEMHFEPERPLGSSPLWTKKELGSALRLRQPRFHRGAVSGLADRRDEDGVSLREAMTEAGFDCDVLGAACRIGDVGAYLELHIEQGPVLEVDSVDIGIVTSIVGLRCYRVVFRGEANHAGTTPMSFRRDAPRALRVSRSHCETMPASMKASLPTSERSESSLAVRT